MNNLLNKYYCIKRYLRNSANDQKIYLEEKAKNIDKQIHFYNWWPHDSHSMWLSDFIEQRGILKDKNKTIAFCSVFNEKEILEYVDTDVRIFFSGENLHNSRHAQYADYMLSGTAPYDLSLGFDLFDDERYLRFPLWLTYMFKPNATNEDIKLKCKQLRFPSVGKRDKFATLIARADWNGIRTDIYNFLSKFGKVDCPSTLFHNDESLSSVFNDNKIEYLKQYSFNICPENTNAYGYVTEKLFEAIEAGCIPIYWGSYNKPELEILNQKAILFWEKNNTNDIMLNNITSMLNSELELIKFANQPRLVDNAEEIIINYFNNLESKLRSILKNN